jgi:hypothetical protein
MFCPNCGKSDQSPDSYCRNCGEFLYDFSAKSYLLNKILGGITPKTQIKVNLIINVVTLFASFLLLGFLKGYYDSLYEKTGELTPRIIYLVYIFLGLISAWQFLSLLINSKLNKKLARRNKASIPNGSSVSENDLSSPSTQRSLPQMDINNINSVNVTQRTTKILDKSR